MIIALILALLIHSVFYTIEVNHLVGYVIGFVLILGYKLEVVIDDLDKFFKIIDKFMEKK